ncbi:hypothetical protein FIBSPDRAFT_966510, partial [Athelia psychrophila]
MAQPNHPRALLGGALLCTHATATDRGPRAPSHSSSPIGGAYKHLALPLPTTDPHPNVLSPSPAVPCIYRRARDGRPATTRAHLDVLRHLGCVQIPCAPSPLHAPTPPPNLPQALTADPFWRSCALALQGACMGRVDCAVLSGPTRAFPDDRTFVRGSCATLARPRPFAGLTLQPTTIPPSSSPIVPRRARVFRPIGVTAAAVGLQFHLGGVQISRAPPIHCRPTPTSNRPRAYPGGRAVSPPTGRATLSRAPDELSTLASTSPHYLPPLDVALYRARVRRPTGFSSRYPAYAASFTGRAKLSRAPDELPTRASTSHTTSRPSTSRFTACASVGLLGSAAATQRLQLNLRVARNSRAPQPNCQPRPTTSHTTNSVSSHRPALLCCTDTRRGRLDVFTEPWNTRRLRTSAYRVRRVLGGPSPHSHQSNSASGHRAVLPRYTDTRRGHDVLTEPWNTRRLHASAFRARRAGRPIPVLLPSQFQPPPSLPRVISKERLKIHLEESDSFMVNLEEMVATALTDFPDDDKSDVSIYAAKLAQSCITGDTRAGHFRIAKAYIMYHRLRNPTWDAKAVTVQTPYHIREFITQKCGPKEQNFEGKK